MNYSLSPASVGGRTRRRRGGVETLPLVIGGRRQRGGVGEGENGDMVVEEQMMGAGYKQRGGVDGATDPTKGEGQTGDDQVPLGSTNTGGGYMMPKGRRQRRRESRRQSRRQRKGGEKKSKKSKKSRSRSKSRQRR